MTSIVPVTLPDTTTMGDTDGGGPVDVPTCSNTEEDVRQADEPQATAHLARPVDPEAFTETIRSFRAFWLETPRRPTTGSGG